MKQRIQKNLDSAIKMMRDACDDAERRSRNADAAAIQNTLHALSWGFANASSSIVCAMAALEDGHEIAAYEGKSNV